MKKQLFALTIIALMSLKGGLVGMGAPGKETHDTDYCHFYVETLRNNQVYIKQYLTDNFSQCPLHCVYILILLEEVLSSESPEENSLAIKQLIIALSGVGLDI